VTRSAAVSTESVADWPSAVEETIDLLRTLHPNPFLRQDREMFNRVIGSARRRVRSASPQQGLVAIARVVAALHDGHTRVVMGSAPFGDRPWNLRLPRVGLSFRWFQNGIYVIGSSEQAHEFGLIGGRVEKVGRADADIAFEAASACVSAENVWRHRALAPSLLTLPDVVHGLGFHDRPDETAFVITVNGQRKHVTLLASRTDGPIVHPATASAPGLYRATANATWTELEGGALYLKYDECLDHPDRPLREVFASAFEAIRSAKSDRFVLDLRHNGGGNNYLNWPLIYEIIRTESINRPGHLFAIVGRHTFSAAMNCVTALERHTAVRFVGEPTGAAPNHFGDPRPHHLTAASVQVDISTLWWQESYPDDHRLTVEPHRAVQSVPDDFRTGHDRVLAAALAEGEK
jgi:hypothetical protein